MRLQTDRLYFSFLAEALFVRFIIRDAVCASRGVGGSWLLLHLLLHSWASLPLLLLLLLEVVLSLLLLAALSMNLSLSDSSLLCVTETSQ